MSSLEMSGKVDCLSKEIEKPNRKFELKNIVTKKLIGQVQQQNGDDKESMNLEINRSLSRLNNREKVE